jgi:CRISPR-associated protein Csm3
MSYKFTGKYIIKADIRCITGLHVGGTDEGFEIGGIDNPVIKDPITGYPYIPGSSLKGKMRSLLEWVTNHRDKVKVNEEEKEVERTRVENMLRQKDGAWTASVCNCGECDVCIIFGCSAATGAKEPTRLTVRDSFPKGLFDGNGKMRDEDEITDGTIAEWRKNLGEKIYTEAKTENAIDRLTSAANPRTMERVPADSVFEIEMVYDRYKDDDVKKLKRIFEGMALVEDSSLGGGGSRGSGKVKFENFRIIKRDVTFYTNGGKETEIELNGKNTAKEISDNFDKLFVTRA